MDGLKIQVRDSESKVRLATWVNRINGMKWRL